MPKTVRFITHAAVIAAIYALLTILTQPISYGPIQFRVSEALCVLPLLFPESVVGLTIGCLIANIFGNGIFDIVLGTSATLIAAVGTFFVGKYIRNTAVKLVLGELAPCIANGLIIPVVLILSGVEIQGYFVEASFIFLSEAVCLGVLGTALYFAVKPLMNIINGKAEPTADVDTETSEYTEKTDDDQ